ncbi:MAG: PAS domain S-box protein [Nitrospirae bacterium]|nr:PAS domain S-box protein [Nitrospirota bacterium]
MIQFCLNLQGKTLSKFSLGINELNEDDLINKISEMPIYLYYYQVLKLIILFIYGSYNDALKLTLEILKNILIFNTRYIITEVYFYYAMCITQLFPKFSEKEKKHYSKELDDSISKMKTWADNCPENFLHKYLLMCAEKARIEGFDLRAMELYDRAIDMARQNEFLSNEALANELAAVYYLNKGRNVSAKGYMTNAKYLYNQWGATEKVKDLEERYPTLLTPATKDINLTAITLKEDSIFLDRLAVIKASQAISGEMDMDKLLIKLIKILLEYSGADRCVIIEKKVKELNIIAIGESVETKIELYKSNPLSGVSKSVINYTANTSEILISGDMKSEEIFKGDPYLKNKHIGSILCIPVVVKSETSYILYLENSALSGIFNTERLEIIKILSAQASISLEAARVFKEIIVYKQIVSTSEEHLSIVDRNYTYKVVNDAYLKAHDREKHDIVGHSIAELLGQEAFEQFIKENIDRTLSGESLNYQAFFDFKGIGRKFMDVYYYPIYEDNGNINQIVVNARDITKIKGYEDKLKKYSLRILSAHDEERKRIAMELHDSLAQSLLLLKMKAQGNKYSELILDISHIIDELRNITMNLRPAFIEKVSLASILKMYSKQFEERSKITIIVNAPREVELDAHIKEHLFRIYQEALNNILKHSGADYVRVGMNCENGRVVLTIEDNGKGFMKKVNIHSDKSIIDSGLGLFTMRERASSLNGTFEVNSSNLGTSLTIKVPIDVKL